MTRRALCLILAAAALGFFAWAGPASAVALALAMPALWACAGSRATAGATVLAYQLAATRSAPISFANFYGSFVGIGVLLWLASAIVIAAVWFAFWSASRRRRLFLIPFAAIATAVPPIGIVGWVHPLTAAGFLFPGTSWLGLLAAALLMTALAGIPWRYLPAACGALFVWAAFLAAPPSGVPGWTGIDTKQPFGRGGADFQRDYFRQVALGSLARNKHAAVVIFPESAAGFWSSATANLWARELLTCPDRLVLLGAEVPDQDGRSTNALVVVSATTAETVYRQRMPVPLSMWRPWSSSGTRAFWFQNPVVTIAGKRAAVFICYEQLIPWTVLHSLSRRPEVLIACSNDWWCPNSTIPAIQLNSVAAWARLFAVPCVTSTNY